MNAKTYTEASTPVLIVGGGPTGLLASILLSKLDIDHVLVEQRTDIQQAPAAHVINTRTMEIYRQAGINVDDLYALDRHQRAHQITWKGRPEEPPIGIFDMAAYRGSLSEHGSYSKEHTANISQHLLEEHLKSVAEQSPQADLRYGIEWKGFATEDRQTSTLADANGNVLEVSHQFLLAADGAGSPVARALNIRKIGPDAIATLLNLTCDVDITQVTGDDETLLYWLLDPDVQGTFIVHDPHQLSVYMHPIAVPYESVDDYDDARCEQLLRKVFGDVPYTVRHKGVWKMTAQIAEKFRIGSVFLAGDAIHRFPPTGGLGLNTGVGDVHNLVWKLAVALKGEVAADQVETLLESYELERKPVAQRNCDVSRRNNAKMTEVVEALGLDPSRAGVLARVMNSRLVKLLPESLQQTVYRIATRPVKNILSDAIADDSNGTQIRERVASAIANQREHFGSQGLDLGYVYRAGSVVDSSAADTPGSEVTTYNEVVGAGARFPQRKLDNGASLHDELDYATFTLFRNPGTDISAPDTFGVAVRESNWQALTCRDGRGVPESLGLEPGQWALVRPDGHVMASG